MIAPDNTTGGRGPVKMKTAEAWNTKAGRIPAVPLHVAGGAEPPGIEVIRYAAGGVACIIATAKLSPSQVEHVQDLIPRGAVSLPTSKGWNVWAVWIDNMYATPKTRPVPSFRIRFGC